jgi:hypothetical protein
MRLPLRVYAGAAGIAVVVYLVGILLVIVGVLPPAFEVVAFGLWIATPIGGGVAVAIAHRQEQNEIVRTVRDEQPRAQSPNQ